MILRRKVKRYSIRNQDDRASTFESITSLPVLGSCSIQRQSARYRAKTSHDDVGGCIWLLIVVIGDQVITEGEWLSLNGYTAELILKNQPLAPPAFSGDLEILMSWADQFRKFRKLSTGLDIPNQIGIGNIFGDNYVTIVAGVGDFIYDDVSYERENRQVYREMKKADAYDEEVNSLEEKAHSTFMLCYVDDIITKVADGGEGTKVVQFGVEVAQQTICAVQLEHRRRSSGTRRSVSGVEHTFFNTEYMFLASDERIKFVRKMIMAETYERRQLALDLLFPYHKFYFEGIFQAMDGLPVTIRLLDPPLHEFLPEVNLDEIFSELTAKTSMSETKFTQGSENCQK
ncbi:hypothetical protein QQ045_029751 [Rhodiola kirilowii]